MLAVKEFLSTQELAELLGLPLSTVYSLNSEGRGPRRMRVGKRVIYRRADVERWLDGRIVDADRGDVS